MSSLKPVLFMCRCDSIGQNKQMRQWKQEKLKKRFCIPPPYWFSLGQTMKIKIRFDCKNWLYMYIQLKVKALLSFYSLKQPQLHTSKKSKKCCNVLMECSLVFLLSVGR